MLTQPPTKLTPDAEPPQCSKPKLSEKLAKPFFVEIFAGCASLSRAVADSGFSVVAIDHMTAKPFFPISQLDLTTSSGQDILWQVLDSPHLLAVHVGLPCGTASRAREKKIPSHLKNQGVPEPPPLRSPRYPLGLANLSPVNEAKVAAANDLFRLCLHVILFCVKRNVLVSVENPGNSLTWAELVELLRQEFPRDFADAYNFLQMVQFHACCFGSKRRKLTGWLGTPKVFQSLQQHCQGDHEHEPFGVHHVFGQWKFDTSLEAAYPRQLAQAVAACLSAVAKQRGFSLTPQPRLHDQATAVQGRQSKHHLPLIPEFHHFVTLPSGQAIPEQGRVVAPHIGGNTEVLTNNSVKVGIFHTQEQFVKLALHVEHPMDTTQHLDEVIQNAVDHVLKTEPKALELERKILLLKLKIRAKQLQPQEQELHASLPPSVEKVVKGKNLLLWKELLELHGYDDCGVYDFLCKGVPLVGSHDEPSCYPSKIVPATLTETDLRDTAVWRRKALIQKRRENLDKDHAKHLETTADEEISLDFLEGPYWSEGEVSQRLGHEKWCLVRRFVLVQGAELKLRPIDDALECQLNQAFTSKSYLKLQDIDFVVGFAMTIAQKVESGKQAFGSGQWLGKCLDLSKAYKQMAILPAHRDLAVIFFVDSQGQNRFYIPNSLLFGSTAAVYSFNRVSRSLWFLMNKILHIPCSVFYDDYPLFSPEETAESADASASDFLDLLGWRHARTGPKGLPFKNKFTVLGAEIDLADICSGRVTLSNKPGRVERIVQLLEGHSKMGRISLHEAQVVHGLFRYACGFFAGRGVLQLCNEILALGLSNGKVAPSQVVAVCDYAREVLACARPRQLQTGLETKPILVFTDGSWDGTYAGIGAAVIDTLTDERMVYAGEVPSELTKAWSRTSSQIISQIELFALVLIRWIWKEKMTDRRCIFFIDNEAARYAAIKGSSDNLAMRNLMRAFLALDLTHPMFAWIERVPSKSNVADPPSRQSPGEACSLLGIETWEELSTPKYLLEFLLKGLVWKEGGKRKTSLAVTRNGKEYGI